MKKSVVLAVIALTAVTLAPLFAQTVNVSGQWTFTIDTGQQTIEKIYTIEQTGEKIVLTRTRKDENGKEESVKLEGTVKGNKIEWTENGNINGSDIKIVSTGTIEGNAMSGETDFGGNASFSWKAVKKI